MPGYLRQATASQSRTLGPFLDDTDFKTPETGLTIANTDIKLMANGAASANKNSGGGTHRQSGHYGVTFDATDSATLGELTVSVVVSGALPVWDKFMVIPAQVYDSLVAGISRLEVNPYALEFSTTATPGDIIAYEKDNTTIASQKTLDVDPTAQYIVGAH